MNPHSNFLEPKVPQSELTALNTTGDIAGSFELVIEAVHKHDATKVYERIAPFLRGDADTTSTARQHAFTSKSFWLGHRFGDKMVCTSTRACGLFTNTSPSTGSTPCRARFLRSR